MDAYESELIAMIRDNEQTMIALGRLFENEYGLPHIGCACHAFQLVIKDTLVKRYDNDRVTKQACAILTHLKVFHIVFLFCVLSIYVTHFVYMSE